MWQVAEQNAMSDMIATANDAVFSAGFFMKLNAKEPAATKSITIY